MAGRWSASTGVAPLRMGVTRRFVQNRTLPEPVSYRGLARLSQLAVKHPQTVGFPGAWCRKVGTTEWTVIMLSECRPL